MVIFNPGQQLNRNRRARAAEGADIRQMVSGKYRLKSHGNEEHGIGERHEIVREGGQQVKKHAVVMRGIDLPICTS